MDSYYDEDTLFDNDDDLLRLLRRRDIPDDLLLHAQPPPQRRNQRSLEGGGGGGNNQNNKYLVADKDGVEYDPYSLSWRYLGIYIDCDINAIANDIMMEGGGDGGNGENKNNHKRRQLPEDDKNKNNGDQCPRKLLWAAYIDKRYEGNTIEEYKFYDIASGEWNNSTCLASETKHRCVNLNCHEPHTKHFTLVGVFKETNGIYDWFEQLFKHEGMCIWNDEDVYDTMTTWMEKWPTQCKKLEMRDDYDNNLYLSTTPLPEGNMTLGIYTDNSCTQLSDYMDYEIYITRLYQNYYEKSYYYRYGYGYYYQYYYNQAQQMIQEYKTALATWNEYMSSFKICQPCRAYNLLWNQNREKGDKHYERRTERNNDRMLGNNNNNNNNDGDGSEQARYNCYDAAGYTNVNQCYKFETKTSMAIAEPDDLARASEQGSILLIKAYGTVYGEGGYMSQSELDVQAIYNISLAVLAICSFALCIGCIARYCRARRNTMEGKSSSSSLSETFYEEDSDFDDKEHVDTTTKRSSAGTRSWWNRSSRKKRRIVGIDIGTVHKHADIESGSYTPPSRQETPSNSSDWLKITSVSTNSFEIEMKKFNNETEKVRMSKSNLLQTPLRTFVSEVGIMNATSHAESTASVIAVDGNTISSTSPPAAASDVLVSPPPPKSLVSIHDSSINADLDVAAPPSLHESLVSDHDISIREHTEDDTTSPDISIQKHAEAAPNMAAPPPLPETLVLDHDSSIQKHAEVDTTTTDAAVSDVAAPLPLPESLELDHDRSSFLEHANEVTTSPDAASNVAAPPPLPESLVTDHDSNSRGRTDDDAQLGAVMERSNYIGFESEMLDSSDNDNNLISSCIGYDDSSHLRTNDDILAATSRNNETRVFDHVGNIGAFEHDSSTEGSVSLNDSSTLPIEVVAADNSSSLAGPALLLVLLMKQEAAAVLIQAQWRRFVASKSFLRKRNAAVACQCKIRKWSARRRVTQMRSHLTMTIQRSESQPEAQTQRNRDATRVKCIPNRSRRFNYTKY